MNRPTSAACVPRVPCGGRQGAPLAVNAGAVVAAAQAAEVALRLAAPCALAVAAAGLSRVADALAALVIEGLWRASCYTRRPRCKARCVNTRDVALHGYARASTATMTT